jgi:hypothetical protein
MMIIAGVVATNNAERCALMQRTGSGYPRTSMTVRSALVRAILVGLEPRQAPSLPSIYERTGCFCTNQAALGDEASLYEHRRRCGRAGEVLSREGNQVTPGEYHEARSKDDLYDEARRTGDS